MKELGDFRSTFLSCLPAPSKKEKKKKQTNKKARKLNSARTRLRPRPCSEHPWVCYLWLDRLLKTDFLVVSAEIVYGNWEAVDPPCLRVQKFHFRRGHSHLYVFLWGLQVPDHEGALLGLHGRALRGPQTVADLTTDQRGRRR